MVDQADYEYDVFISYSHNDSGWVRGKLLPWLEEAGLRVIIDYRDFTPGVPSLVNMEKAVERSRKTLIVLTPAWVESQWTAFESLLIQTDDPAGRSTRVIPLLLKPCDPPKRIAMLNRIDFTQPSGREVQEVRLLKALGSSSEASLPLSSSPAKKRAPATASEPSAAQPLGGLELPLAEVVTPEGKLVRGWLVKVYDVLRDPMWQGIAGIVALLALTVTIGGLFWPDIKSVLLDGRAHV